MTVLFVDFDGTLHPERCSIDLLFCKLPLLEEWLSVRTDVLVVISSSWREAHPLQEMLEFFSAEFRHRVVGVTPILRESEWAESDGELLPIRFGREAEIEQWRRGSAEPWRPWLALDDQPWLFRPFCPNLIPCDATTGLTCKELDLMDTKLGCQAGSISRAP